MMFNNDEIQTNNKDNINDVANDVEDDDEDEYEDAYEDAYVDADADDDEEFGGLKLYPFNQHNTIATPSSHRDDDSIRVQDR